MRQQATNHFGFVSKALVFSAIGVFRPLIVVTLRGHCRNVGSGIPFECPSMLLKVSDLTTLCLWRPKCGGRAGCMNCSAAAVLKG